MNLLLAVTLIILLLIVISKLGGISKALHAIRGEKNNEIFPESPKILTWSNTPGCFEKHLQRKYNNLLFPAEKREISQQDIDLAIEQDLRDIQSIEADYKKLLLASHKETSSVSITINELSKIQDNLDALIQRCFEVGGASLQILPGLRDLNEIASTSIEDGIAENDKEAAKKFSKAREEYLKSFAFSNEFLAQMIRKDTPIKAEEVVASLLSEDLETIKLVANNMGLLGKEKEMNLQAEAIVFAHLAEVEGVDKEILREKLKTLGVPLK